MIANLSTVALDGMDPDNSKELEKDRKNMQEAQRRKAKRYMREKLRKATAAASGTKKHRSNIKWARRICLRTSLLGSHCAPSIGLRIAAIGSLAMTVITTLL